MVPGVSRDAGAPRPDVRRGRDGQREDRQRSHARSHARIAGCASPRSVFTSTPILDSQAVGSSPPMQMKTKSLGSRSLRRAPEGRARRRSPAATGHLDAELSGDLGLLHELVVLGLAAIELVAAMGDGDGGAGFFGEHQRGLHRGIAAADHQTFLSAILLRLDQPIGHLLQLLTGDAELARGVPRRPMANSTLRARRSPLDVSKMKAKPCASFDIRRPCSPLRCAARSCGRSPATARAAPLWWCGAAAPCRRWASPPAPS